MTETEFKSEIKKGLKGGYFFFGDEDFLKYNYAIQAKNSILDGVFDDFNHFVLYPETYTPTALAEAITTAPMMAEKKLVELRAFSVKGLKADEMEKFLSALELLKEYDYTVLIVRLAKDGFDPGRLPRSPSEAYKKLETYLTPVCFDFPREERIRTWIARHFGAERIAVSPMLCDELVRVCGHDMWALSREIEKLCIYLHAKGRDTLSPSDIQEVSCHTIEYDTFALSNAITDGKRADAFETLRRQKLDRQQPILLLSSVIRIFCDMLLVKIFAENGCDQSAIATRMKMHEFKVGRYLKTVSRIPREKLEEAVRLCREADLEFKSGVSGFIPVEKLICAAMEAVR
ncbi:MAG: DNA polymerase III subunit delta [Clostridia bacterium]|nr:DNA polymerase III subunit delta [Clostridia bacterium]